MLLLLPPWNCSPSFQRTGLLIMARYIIEITLYIGYARPAGASWCDPLLHLPFPLTLLFTYYHYCNLKAIELT